MSAPDPTVHGRGLRFSFDRFLTQLNPFSWFNGSSRPSPVPASVEQAASPAQTAPATVNWCPYHGVNHPAVYDQFAGCPFHGVVILPVFPNYRPDNYQQPFGPSVRDQNPFSTDRATTLMANDLELGRGGYGRYDHVVPLRCFSQLPRLLSPHAFVLMQSCQGSI